jgi:hypothetical protein
MKTPTLGLLNSIGLQNEAQKAALAAQMLHAATVSSPAVTIAPAVAAVAAKPAIIAQTAKPARAATVAVTAVANTTGYGFGELYLNSPAYPAGTAIPAIPAKPASAAVVGVPAVVAVPAVAAVIAPAITALKGWEDAITITKAVDSFKIVAFLPYSSSPALIGAPSSGIDTINEITQPALQPTAWLDAKASNTLGTAISEPATLERYLYKQALALVAQSGSTSTIENVTKPIIGGVIACKKLTLNLTATDYTLGVDSLQLGKLA